jgi:hypothetical protein
MYSRSLLLLVLLSFIEGVQMPVIHFGYFVVLSLLGQIPNAISDLSIKSEPTDILVLGPDVCY